MRGAGGDYERVAELLAEAGITLPPVPESLQKQLKERHDWWFSTRTSKATPYELLHYARKAMEGAAPDYALIAKVGPPASPAMHYFLVQAPLQLFIQIAYGDVGRARSVAVLSQCFELAHRLVAATPAAARRGKLTADGRLTVVASDLCEGFWEIAMGTERGVQPGRGRGGKLGARRGPVEILEEALRWCRT
ncbi:MAG TPA: hypothetical protein VMG58_17880 [Candidatus Sulfotelmatobacter sp.]|nr:hypothetical protein [Candidatus Sulfotelmatobacter sp.]